MEDIISFDPELIHSIYKLVWSKKSDRIEGTEGMDVAEVGVGTSKKSRPTTANSNALKVSCELLRIFVTEAVQRAAIISEAEGSTKIEATHFERILPQLLLDF
uniref:Centromere protein X n=1 Tax=Anthurium amnicola TaxID=1678845 RepID=A0A1D1Z5R1_9ARAE